MHPALWKDRVQRAARDPLTTGLWGLAAIFLACCAFFHWAADRGFDVSDEAVYVLSSAGPNRFPLLTEYAAVWHPLYLLGDGNLIAFRLLGLLVLQACGLFFSIAIARFVRPALPARRARLSILLLIAITLFWEYDNWLPTPGYNLLNACGLMLFFAGLLFAGADRSDTPRWNAVALPALLSGFGLCVMLWCKPPSAALGGLAGIVWMIGLRQKRPLLALGVAAATLLIVYSLSILLIDGSLHAFLARKSVSLENMHLIGGGHNLNGIVQSAVSPFLPSAASKQVGAALAGLALLIPAAIWFLAMRFAIAPSRYVAAMACALLLAVAVAVFRTRDFAPGTMTANFHGWYVGLLICAAITIGSVRGLLRQGRHTLLPMILLAAAPVIYSLGTGNTLLWHMASASVFWAGAAVIAIAVEPPAQRGALLAMAGALCGLVTLGMLDGMAHVPIRHGAPLWRQTEPVAIGPAGTRLRLDPQSAEYLRSLQDHARNGGFRPQTPVLDLSGYGPGIVLALNGRALGGLWLHLSFAGGPMTYIRHALAAVPREQLCHAWILTGSPAAAPQERDTLLESGLGFPARYEKIVTLSRPDADLYHTLWKPRTGDGCRT